NATPVALSKPASTSALNIQRVTRYMRVCSLRKGQRVCCEDRNLCTIIRGDCLIGKGRASRRRSGCHPRSSTLRRTADRSMMKQLEKVPDSELAMPASIEFPRLALQTADQPISYFMQQAVENPNLISLAAGLVDQESLPVAEIAETVAELLRQPKAGRTALQY